MHRLDWPLDRQQLGSVIGTANSQPHLGFHTAENLKAVVNGVITHLSDVFMHDNAKNMANGQHDGNHLVGSEQNKLT